MASCTKQYMTIAKAKAKARGRKRKNRLAKNGTTPTRAAFFGDAAPKAKAQKS